MISGVCHYIYEVILPGIFSPIPTSCTMRRCIVFDQVRYDIFNHLNPTTMGQNNVISTAITAADKQAAIDLIHSIKPLLANVMQYHLAPKQRREVAKMGDKTLAFVDKSLELMDQNPELIATFLNVSEARKDYELARSLYDILLALKPIVRALEDAMILAGSEAYEASLIYYAIIKSAAKGKEPGIQALYDELHKRFPRGKQAYTSEELNEPHND